MFLPLQFILETVINVDHGFLTVNCRGWMVMVDEWMSATAALANGKFSLEGLCIIISIGFFFVTIVFVFPVTCRYRGYSRIFENI